MALTAARTELNVSLVGEDETIRMLEDAKKRMAELEAKTRSLTGATQAQTQAAKSQTEATGGLNSTLGRMGSAISGPLEGIGKLKESINKGIEIFGFLGMAVNGAITAFDFLVDAFDDSEEKAAALEKQVARNKAETDRLKAATDALTSSLHRMKAATGQSAAVLAAERATLAELRGDMVTAAFERAGVAIEQQKAAIADLSAEESKRETERKQAVDEMIATQARLSAAQSKEKELLRQASKADSDAIQKFNKTEARERAAQLRNEASAQKVLGLFEQEKLKLATETRDSIDKANESLRERIKINKLILDQQLINLGKSEEEGAAAKSGGGGGARAPGPIEDETKQREEDWEKFSGQLAREIRERADYARHVREMQASEAERRKALAGEGALFQDAQNMRDRLAAELRALPGDVATQAFAPLRTELDKNIKALDEFLASRIAVGDRVAITLEEEDAIAAAYGKQAEALDKLKGSMSEFAEMHAKAAEQMQRDSLAGYVNGFAESLQQLGQMQAPVFEVVTESLAGINAQMGKFKEGQQSLTTAIVGSAGAIAGAVGKKIDNVKLEAGIRALFETAMGFATLGNPAESVGHFTAAAMFGLVAGGVIPTTSKSGKDGGGSKAPAKTEAKSRDSMMGGGGGQVTNVYNLQTGIVDGQSTAQAFRRAEMQARNTGMASAGGW